MSALRQNFVFDVIVERKLAIVQMWGEVKGENVIEAMAAVYSDRRWQKNFDVFWDLSAASELIFEWSDFQDFLDLDKDLGSLVGTGCDIILVRSDLHEAIIKTYAQLAKRSARSAIVYRTLADVNQALA